jgi:hypothetical protein
LPQLYGLQAYPPGYFLTRQPIGFNRQAFCLKRKVVELLCLKLFASAVSLFALTPSLFILIARMVSLACQTIWLTGQAFCFNGLANCFAGLPLQVAVLASGFASPNFFDAWQINSSKLAAITLHYINFEIN